MASSSSSSTRTKVFISYSHADKEWLERLKRHLKPLVREGNLDCWDDTHIRPGDDWKQEIQNALDTAQVAVLLISADFFASDFIDETELPPLLDAAQAEGVLILPVILSASRFARNPDLARFQAVNSPNRPLAKMTRAKREEVLDRLAQTIEKAIENTSGWRGSPCRDYLFQASRSDLPLPTDPYEFINFTGRIADRDKLITILSQGGRCAAIIGMGGTGKTKLAVRVARDLAERYPKPYPDGQLFIDLRGTTAWPLSPLEVMGMVIHSFDPMLRLPKAPKAVTKQYQKVLENNRVLLVFDNAADRSQVLNLLPSPPGAALVTARCTLALTDRPDTEIPLGLLSEAEAVGLLSEIVGSERGTEAELMRIAGSCGHLPLALRVAGTFLRMYPNWTVEKYAAVLADERKRLQRLCVKDDPELNVAASLGLSVQQLEREQPELTARWRLLAVFPADFNQAAVAAVWAVVDEEALDGLSELVSRSMVLFDQTVERYYLHDLMRDVAQQDGARLDAARARHAAYYAGVSKTAEDDYLKDGENQLENQLRALALFDAERANVEAGMRWIIEQHPNSVTDSEITIQIICAYMGDGGHIRNLRQQPKQRIPWFEAAVHICRKLNDEKAEVAALTGLAYAYLEDNQLEEAERYYCLQLKKSRAIGDQRMEGRGLGGLGMTYEGLGKTDLAISYHKQRLANAQKIRYGLGKSYALNRLGEIYLAKSVKIGNINLAKIDLGQVSKALRYFNLQLLVTQKIKYPLGEAGAYWGRARALKELNRPIEATENAKAALAIYRKMKYPTSELVEHWLARP